MAESANEKFWDMIGDFETCMVTTRDGRQLRSRPMAPKISRERGEILFVTDRSSHKVDEIQADDQVACSFVKKEEYVAVSGTASVTTDRARIDEAWDPQAEAWMPGGKDGPDTAILVIRPHQAEIWDVTSNKITQAWEFAKAYVGDKPRPDTTENVKVNL
ncbi:pyridoxamine 5'-phosphate oxidase family protein [Aureimonas phyllosphaerae]|uniref:General stress protein 26 n=1 Tax=Aureimonas phyllosphaerae TaxID=1166078 RepID=A0A7W6C2U6_9HYPH|nr:pyridoxamine 5'-phosphate oxidase family protein [Aureimonas phyllosphaerae]MBB3937437.1 general stress protein 26 [Aureimonas phyllosphaerae]MBB3961497.1 general stress protein 26 [Aureimonas phyllosphaerae]SFF38737.1 General stress protein 26 [Aureimonas phyllosphaerae]